MTAGNVVDLTTLPKRRGSLIRKHRPGLPARTTSGDEPSPKKRFLGLFGTARKKSKGTIETTSGDSHSLGAGAAKDDGAAPSPSSERSEMTWKGRKRGSN